MLSTITARGWPPRMSWACRSTFVAWASARTSSMLALHGTKKHPQKVKVSAMTFGYPDRESGRFRRFKIVYSIPTDQITVSKQ